MPTTLYVSLVVLVWLACGFGAAFFLLGRHGYRDRRWYLLGGVLGPLFIPIAAERGRRGSAVLERTPAPGPQPAVPRGDGPTVVIGVDSSDGGDAAVRQAARVFRGARPRWVLVGVLDPDVGEFDDGSARRQAGAALAERAGWLPAEHGPAAVEICTGEPGRTLVAAARAEGADVILVGRRGRGLSHRLLGSVADHLVRQAEVPVLLVPPAGHPVGRGASRSGAAAP